MSTKVITGKVRFSYANVFEPVAQNEGDEPRYSTAILIPKSDKKTVAKINAAIKEALEEGISKFGGKIPKAYKSPLRDGDEDRDDEVYAGHYFLSAKSPRKPQVVDADLEPIMDRDDFYSGCYGRASITFYAFNTAGNKGVAVALNNLQKLEDGERLGGSASTAEQDFGDIDDDDLL